MKKGIDSLITWSNKLIDSKMNYRLPDNLKPSLYQLEIQPFILDKPFTFKGKCNITFNCVQPTIHYYDCLHWSFVIQIKWVLHKFIY